MYDTFDDIVLSYYLGIKLGVPKERNPKFSNTQTKTLSILTDLNFFNTCFHRRNMFNNPLIALSKSTVYKCKSVQFSNEINTLSNLDRAE